MFLELLPLVNLTLNFSTFIERDHQVENLLDLTEVDFDRIHDEGVVELAENVELALGVVLVAWLQRD